MAGRINELRKVTKAGGLEHREGVLKCIEKLAERGEKFKEVEGTPEHARKGRMLLFCSGAREAQEMELHQAYKDAQEGQESAASQLKHEVHKVFANWVRGALKGGAREAHSFAKQGTKPELRTEEEHLGEAIVDPQKLVELRADAWASEWGRDHHKRGQVLAQLQEIRTRIRRSDHDQMEPITARELSQVFSKTPTRRARGQIGGSPRSSRPFPQRG